MNGSRAQTHDPVTVLVVSSTGSVDASDLQGLWDRLEASAARCGGATIRHEGMVLTAEFYRQEAQAAGGDAAYAVESALEMLREGHAAGLAVSLRAGVHRGLVDAADAGTALVRQIAENLCRLAKPGQVLITEAVYRQTRGLVDVQALDPIPALPPGMPESIFRVWGMRPRPVRPTPYIGATVMVGRDKELAFLQAGFDQAVQTGKARLITVVGPAGMGKSRLLNDFLRRLDGQNQPFILFRGRADPTASSLPHAMLRDLLAFRFKILESDPPELARAKLVGGVQDWLGPEGVEAAHWMGQVAGLDFSNSPFLRDQLQDTGRIRLQALVMMRRFISAVAANTPVLVLLDNMQWADDGSLDGLEALARLKPTGPILIVVLARPELLQHRPNWGECTATHCTLTLGPLQRDETAAMSSQTLRSALGSRRDVGQPVENGSADLITLPARLIDRIVEASGGNPYFVEELVKNYLETGILVAEEAASETGEMAWRIDMVRLATVQPPGSLDEALLAHLDVLSPFERAVIHRAAVVGQVFWDAAVQVLLEKIAPEDCEPGRPGDLNRALRALQMRGLILRRESSVIEGAVEYLFRSPQLHAVAYANASFSLKLYAHEQVGDWLAAHHSGREEVHASTIAAHYDRGGAPVRAAEWYARAGVMARRVAAPEAAVRFFIRALETLPEGEKHLRRRVEWYSQLWDVQWWQTEYGAALATARDLLTVAETYNDVPAQAAAWNRMAAIYNRLGESKAALQSVQRAERLARRVGATGEVVKALFNRGVTLDQLGHSAEALEVGQQALDFNQAMLDQGADSEAVHEAARILTLMGTIHQRAGRFELARDNFCRLLEVYRKRGEVSGMVTALMYVGDNDCLQGDHQRAARSYQEALNLARSYNFHDQELASLDALAGAHAEMGAYREAEDELREVKQRAAGLHWMVLPEFYRHRALARMGRGRVEEAITDALRALDNARESRSAEQTGRAWRVLGRVLAHNRPNPQANVDNKTYDVNACYAASMQIFVELGLPGEQARTMRDWATYELELGDRREGLRMWREARDIFAGLGMKAEVERMEKVA